MLYMIIVAVALVVPFFDSSMLSAEPTTQNSDGTLYLSFIGPKGDHVLVHANLGYERQPELAEPVIDWSATQVSILKPAAGGAFVKSGGAPLRPDGEAGQMVIRAFEHAKRLRSRDLPNGRAEAVFGVIGAFAVRDAKDLEAALAVAFLAVHNGRAVEPVTILGGLDSQGRLTAVADLNTHLANMIHLGHRKMIIPPGQHNEISGSLQQQIESNHIAVVEAANLEALYTLVTTNSSQH
jgi:hypothetical protein